MRKQAIVFGVRPRFLTALLAATSASAQEPLKIGLIAVPASPTAFRFSALSPDEPTLRLGGGAAAVAPRRLCFATSLQDDCEGPA
mgnify:CR=1 FL=1